MDPRQLLKTIMGRLLERSIGLENKLDDESFVRFLFHLLIIESSIRYLENEKRLVSFLGLDF